VKENINNELGLKSLEEFKKGISKFPAERQAMVSGTLEELIMAILQLEQNLKLEPKEMIFITKMLYKVLQDLHFNMPAKHDQDPMAFMMALEKIDVQ